MPDYIINTADFVLILKVAIIIMVVGVIGIIILENRNPVKTIAWILVLIFLPILGVLLYLYFGEDHKKKYNIYKKLYKGVEKNYKPSFNITHCDTYPPHYEKLVELLYNVNQSHVMPGNKVDFFTSGKSKFDSMFTDIRNARHHVHLLYYKIIDDNIGKELLQLLIEKVKEGVEVKVIYDDVGSLKAKKRFFEDMKREGIEVQCYLEVRAPRFARSFNYRNHRKIAVIDGTIGYVGGMNIEDCYIDGLKWGKWCDMQIRIEGNGVKGLQTVFLVDWYYSSKTLPDSPYYFPETPAYDDNPLQIVSSGPTDIYNSIEKGILQAINLARKNIYIQTPYFIPSETILTALQTAAISGIEVNVMIPKKSDSFFIDGATLSFVRDLLDYNINVFLYTEGFLHTKCTVIDGNLTIVGSANMDVRSFELSFETDAFIYCEDTAKKAIDIFFNDMKGAELVHRQEWLKRPLLRRAFESVMHLFTPLF